MRKTGHFKLGDAVLGDVQLTQTADLGVDEAILVRDFQTLFIVFNAL